MKAWQKLRTVETIIQLGTTKKLNYTKLQIFKWYLRYVTFYAGYIDLRKFRFVELLKICMTNVDIRDGRLEVYNLLYREMIGHSPRALWVITWHWCDFVISEEIGLIMNYLAYKSSLFPINGIFDVKVQRVFKATNCELLPVRRFIYGPVIYDRGILTERYYGATIEHMWEEVVLEPLKVDYEPWVHHPRLYRVMYTLWCAKQKCKVYLYWMIYTKTNRNYDNSTPTLYLKDFLRTFGATVPRVWDNSNQFYIAWYLTIFSINTKHKIPTRIDYY